MDLTIVQARVLVRLSAIVGLGLCIPWCARALARWGHYVQLVWGIGMDDQVVPVIIAGLLTLAVLAIPIVVCGHALFRDVGYARRITRRRT